jgi:hypothetical protein
MEANIPAQHAALPLRATVVMKFSSSTREQPFDFQFNEYSKDLAPAAPASATTRQNAPAKPAAPVPQPQAQAARPPQPSPTQTAKATPPLAPGAVSAPKPAAAVPAGAARPPEAAATPAAAVRPQEAAPDPLASEIAAMPPALAAALDETTLPTTVPGLLAELENRAAQINAFIRAGNLGEVWVPAMGTKTVALVLESHTSTIPARQRAAATGAIKRVVTAAWEIDGYADIGNRPKIVEAYEQLASAVTDLKNAYGSR